MTEAARVRDIAWLIGEAIADDVETYEIEKVWPFALRVERGGRSYVVTVSEVERGDD